MILELRRIAAFLFFALGTSFFVAVVLLRNGMAGTWPGWWMQVADLPLLLCGVVYGGTSMYKSLAGDERSSTLGTILTVLLAAFFVAMATLNFWGPLTSSTDSSNASSSSISSQPQP